MRIARVHLIDSLRLPWSRLSNGSPFCSPDWMGAWINTLSRTASPHTLAVFDQDKVVGIAPFCMHRSIMAASRLEFLATGKACSEYLRLLIDPDYLDSATDVMAKWMIEAAYGDHGDENRWQRLDMESVSADDLATALLCQKLSAMGAQCETNQSASCWRINLTVSREQWLSSLNKSIRRKIRLLETRAIQTGRAVYTIAKNEHERLAMFEKLVALHSARRHQINESGCFDFPGFYDFLNHVITCPDADRLVKVSQLELDGEVVAAGLCLESDNGLFVYQAGISLAPDSKNDIAAANPGWLLNWFHIEYGWERGLAFVDYLRGDEKYKSHLGAVPTRLNHYRVIPPIRSALVRQRLFSFAQSARDLGRGAKQCLLDSF